jgi:hypothetical protein
VQYALGHHVGRVLYKDLAVKSPYNTYINKGLPPGPVAAPGVASLAAAANPANVPYLYFVASPDGHHEFRMTLQEHTSAIREVRGAAAAKVPARAASKQTRTSSAKAPIAKKPASKGTTRRTTSTRKKPTPKRTVRSTRLTR